MSAEAVPEPVNTDLSQLPTDYNSLAIMQKYIVNDQRIPKRVTADGNCFFNAVSLSLYDHEHYSVQIRVRTCIQMCLNKNLYKNHKDAKDIYIVSPSFEQASIRYSTSGEYASTWTMMAASDAMGITIITSYPPINDASDFVYKVLNADFTPNNLKPKSNVTILWTNTTADPSKPITAT
jgi:hypothetical protein